MPGGRPRVCAIARCLSSAFTAARQAFCPSASSISAQYQSSGGTPVASSRRSRLPVCGVIGDSGTGLKPQYDVAKQLARYHEKFPFEFVIMLGDNLYDGAAPADYKKKFEDPYEPLLSAGVKFYASLGNQDDNNEVDYPAF